MKFGIIGSGSWGTALAKILTDNCNAISWWIRLEKTISQIVTRKHNPHYLNSVHFDTNLLQLSVKVEEVIASADCILVVIPSAYTKDVLGPLPKNVFEGKIIISAIKGILPDCNLLLNEYLSQEFNVPPESYFTLLGPCHAEEVAAEKLSYVTFSGSDSQKTAELSEYFQTPYLRTMHNTDVHGVQFAAVLKNIYAIGAGIAHGLEFGDNFLSVLIANSADEMAGFLRRAGIQNVEVGSITHAPGEKPGSTTSLITNYAASVYLGDLLVTCYSLFSRNRTFGNMIGKGYSVKAAQLEMNMVAEGYNASRCMYHINASIEAEMPIAETIYKILWENLPAAEGFELIQDNLI
ncbi:MAG: NAD(P)H-dependent glycerol-3-phosphate dehydrogenase [Ginsengibacter sp.]